MIRLPWTKTETRSDTYTDVVTQALVDAAAGTDDASKARIAVVEAGVSLWARAFASATVQPDSPQARALNPAVLARIGRRLAVRGECVFEIVVNGDVSLVEAADWTVEGDTSWTYKATFATPSGSVVRTLSAEQVVHLQYDSHPSEPWKGQGPLQHSKTTVDLANALELSIRRESGTASGFLLDVPDPGGQAGLLATLRKLRGGLTLTERLDHWESELGGGKSGSAGAWQAKRLGPNFPGTLDPLRDSTARVLLAALGVPPSLIGRSDGSLARESYRQFLWGTISPVARIIEPELSVKLDTGITLDFSALQASDLTGRARAFQGLVAAGVSVDDAARLTGLLIPED